jgi:Lipocalin-like domain
MPDLPATEWADFKGAPIPPEATKTGYTGYFGTYTIDENSSVVIHHIEGSARGQAGVGVDLIRRFEFGTDGSVTLIPTKGGGPIGSRLKWVRVSK